MKIKLRTRDTILIFVTIILFIISKSDSIKHKLAGVIAKNKFNSITRSMETKALDNITYYYANAGDEVYINNVKEKIREGEDKIAPILGQPIIYPLDIVIFHTPEAFGKAFKVNPKESIALTYFDTIYVNTEVIDSYVLVHEYTHYKIRSFCKEHSIQITRVPTWFQEGISEYTSSTFFSDKFKNASIRKVQDFKKLDNSKEMIESEFNGQVSYMQSYLAVKNIIELKGKDSIKDILINTKNMTFYKAFEKVLGLSIDDFKKLLENQLKQTDSVDVLLKTGLTYSQQKDFEKAKEIYLEATKKYPESAQAWLRLSNVYTEMGDFNSSIKAREKLVSIDGEKSYSYFYYSESLISTDLDKAISMAEKSAQLAKTDGSDNPKFIMDYFMLIKKLKDTINSDKPFAQYVTLIESDYIYDNMIKIDIINKVLAKYPNKNDNEKERLIKLKSDLQK